MDVLEGIDLVLDAKADLGEGPSWDPHTKTLIWVDITAGVVHRFDPASGLDESFDAGRPVGAAVPTTSGLLALAVSDGFSLLDPATGEVQRLADVEADDPRTMMNDGMCDPVGNFWAGTKDIEGHRPIASLYRLGADHRVDRIVGDVTISNGLGWSPDRRTMYYIDSPTHGIDALDVDIETGSVGNRRRLVGFPEGWGLPDGMSVDEEGFLWVAFWTGSAVRRVSPDGQVQALVELPVSLVTSCAFGGSDLTDLYVTSARTDLSDERLRAEPAAGGVFHIRPGVRGLPSPPFAG